LRLEHDRASFDATVAGRERSAGSYRFFIRHLLYDIAGRRVLAKPKRFHNLVADAIVRERRAGTAVIKPHVVTD
jgi:hypothetical protein